MVRVCLQSAFSPQDEKERDSERGGGGVRERELLCVFECVCERDFDLTAKLTTASV